MLDINEPARRRFIVGEPEREREPDFERDFDDREPIQWTHNGKCYTRKF